MVTMAQSAAYWRNTHTYVGRTHLHQHSYNHVVRSARIRDRISSIMLTTQQVSNTLVQELAASEDKYKERGGGDAVFPEVDRS